MEYAGAFLPGGVFFSGSDEAYRVMQQVRIPYAYDALDIITEPLALLQVMATVLASMNATVLVGDGYGPGIPPSPSSTFVYLWL